MGAGTRAGGASGSWGRDPGPGANRSGESRSLGIASERCQERAGASRRSLQPAAAAAAQSWASVRGAGGRRVVGGGGCWRLWSGQLGRLLSLWFPLWLPRGCGAAGCGRGREREPWGWGGGESSASQVAWIYMKRKARKGFCCGLREYRLDLEGFVLSPLSP